MNDAAADAGAASVPGTDLQSQSHLGSRRYPSPIWAESGRRRIPAQDFPVLMLSGHTRPLVTAGNVIDP